MCTRMKYFANLLPDATKNIVKFVQFVLKAHESAAIGTKTLLTRAL